MRMWMVDPDILCHRHLLGEHLECHMFYGSILKKMRLDGYIRNNLFEPLSLAERHDELAREMEKRNMKHRSPLIIDPTKLLYLQDILYYRINREKSLSDLLARCQDCLKRFQETIP